MILFKYAYNYYRFNVAEKTFLAYGKQPGKASSVGSWFTCGEEQTKNLMEAIKGENYELCSRIPGLESNFNNLTRRTKNDI